MANPSIWPMFNSQITPYHACCWNNGLHILIGMNDRHMLFKFEGLYKKVAHSWTSIIEKHFKKFQKLFCFPTGFRDDNFKILTVKETLYYCTFQIQVWVKRQKVLSEYISKQTVKHTVLVILYYMLGL